MPKGWVPHVVQRGETLSGLAHSRKTTVDIIWSDPMNDRLRAIRSNPNVLAPTDVVWLPAKPLPKWLSLTTGTINSLVAEVPKHTVTATLRDEDGKPLAGVAYQVDNAVVTPPGTTDGDGTVSFEVSVLVRSVVVRIPEKKLAIPILIGDLDPVSTVSGAIGRLRNLGYGRHPSDVDGVEPKEYAAFLLAWFQRDHGLSETGELDSATQDKLREVGGADRTGVA